MDSPPRSTTFDRSGAGAQVGRSPGKIMAGHAQSAERIAERSVDKDFQLNIRAGFTNIVNFIQGELASQHDPLESPLLKLPHSLDGMNRQLGGSMQGEEGKAFLMIRAIPRSWTMIPSTPIRSTSFRVAMTSLSSSSVTRVLIVR